MKTRTAKMALLPTLLLLAHAAAAQLDTPDSSNYPHSITKWQQEREASLKAPTGWLNLAGLYWLQAGATTIGSSPDTDIQLAKEAAPPRLGIFFLKEEVVTFQTEPGVEVFNDGIAVSQLRMADDNAAEPSLLTHETLGWQIIRRMERIAVRIRDYEHPAVNTFAGLKFYPVDPDWRVEAWFNAYATPRKPMLTTVVEELGWSPTAPGTLEFDHGGETLSLEAYELEDSFFLIFADLTSGETTYPAGRYLYADKPGPDGTTILDFNKAHSPPCAFTNFATCPLPTRENRLKVAIEAGEVYSNGL